MSIEPRAELEVQGNLILHNLADLCHRRKGTISNERTTNLDLEQMLAKKLPSLGELCFRAGMTVSYPPAEPGYN